MQQTLQQTFNRIVGLPLTKTTRTETVQYFHFGHTHYTTPQGLVLDVGEITLAVNCPWQLQQPAGEAIKHSEVFIRKREAGLPTPVWDWKKPGSSLLDQRMANLINNNPNLVVERAEQQGELGLMPYFDYSLVQPLQTSTNPYADFNPAHSRSTYTFGLNIHM